MFLGSGVAYAGPYTNSAHGTSASRTALGDAGFADGNCVHCHEQHMSIGGSEPAPIGGAPSIYMGFAEEENLCYGCHVSVGGVGIATDDIEAEIAKSSAHKAGDYSNKHRAGETLANISANKHVECTDCHNPHEAITGNHVAGTNVVSKALKGVSGAVASFSSSNWTAPSYNLETATKEYEICFKCHSSANTNLAAWDSSWTDVGLEFSPGNASAHPVAAGLGTGPLDALTAAQMTDDWNDNMGTQTMYCSDCHGDSADDTTSGPHGSSSPTILKGLWPKNSANDWWRLNDARLERYGFTADCLCKKCHVILGPDIGDGLLGFQNRAHLPAGRGAGQHLNYACVMCHGALPHGSNFGRLITEKIPGYAYHPVYGWDKPAISVFIKRSPTAYSAGHCKAECAVQHF